MKKIILIGPNPAFSGGIESVIKNQLEYKNSEIIFENLISWQPGSLHGLIFLPKILFSLMKTNFDDTYIAHHIHIGRRGSLIRESIYSWISSCSSKKTIITLHGSDIEKYSAGFKKYLLKYFVLPPADRIVVLTPKTLEIVKNCNFKAYLYPNPVSVKSEFVPPLMRKNFFFFAGRMDTRKGLDLLFQAWEIFVQSSPTESLYLAGPLGDLDLDFYLEKSSNVYYLGVLEKSEVLEYCKFAKCLILPSRAEQSPMFLWEGMTFGTPIISTDVGAVRWMLGENYPLIFEIDNQDQLLEKMRLIDSDSEEYMRLSMQIYHSAKISSAEEYFKIYFNELI